MTGCQARESWGKKVTGRRAADKTQGCDGTQPRQVAQYLRMSTEHQQYSTENQAEAIASYAERHGLEIVCTYADDGKSGLDVDWRPSLQRLIADVTEGRAEFCMILVYDVSRWGRFQDPDQAGHLEYLCRQAGIGVEYCAEPFANDGSLGANIQKMLKRSMAGEYSRELSVKVFAGQCRLVRMGFRQGGSAGFGLRRVRVDHYGSELGILDRGQQKSLQTDRVILKPGPEDEVAIVRRIYMMFVEEGRRESEIAAILNAENITTDLGRPWRGSTLHQVLTNEKYIGNNVFNRRSFKLTQRLVRNPREQWGRADGVFESIIDPDTWRIAQAIIVERSRRFTDQEILDHLKALHARHGLLSAIVIDEFPNGPSSGAIRHRFGSLLRAYGLIGYDSGRDYSYIEDNRHLRRMFPTVVEDTLRRIRDLGGTVRRDLETGLVEVNGEFTISLVIARCETTRAGAHRWTIRLETGLLPDITVAVRMEPGNREIFDYYLLPSIDITSAKLRLAEDNGLGLDAYRFTTLDRLYDLARHVPLREVA
jgi:DNA invertase Pin-like site-specific DNA recombinase